MALDVAKLAGETERLSALELVTWAVGRFGHKIALASSLGTEDQVVLHMLTRVAHVPHVFTLDTGRLPQETYDTIQATRKRYGVTIEILFPEAAAVERLVNQHGPNLFYQSVELRKACCQVRKVEPLRRRLATLEAWMTGLRREQSADRAGVERIEWDAANGLIKLNPLADWTSEQVWQYIREHHVPYNKLHDEGYPSIGCAPCTRAVAAGEDVRAGRWWWEKNDHKECGLHVINR